MAFKICVVGLGLMGASMAQALHGWKNAQITGVDADGAVLKKAVREQMVHRGCTDIAQGVKEADLLIFCVYAKHIPGLLRQALPQLKPSCVVTDICGVKTPLYAEVLPMLPPGLVYVGIHPMAGRERAGIENADAALFQNTGLLLCPTVTTTAAAMALMEALAAHIGCGRTEVTAYPKHDAIIAYTSDLMHLSAAGLCLSYPPEMNGAYTAGAYRDSTRVADIDAAAWTELLLENRGNTLNTLERYIGDLQSLRDAIDRGDEAELHALLQRAGNNKREMLKR